MIAAVLIASLIGVFKPSLGFLALLIGVCFVASTTVGWIAVVIFLILFAMAATS
jgi:hypothetical protein